VSAASAAPPELSWVVPMYRTAEFLEELAARIALCSQALGLSFELVLVDDACPQGSGEHAQRLHCPGLLRVLRLPRNGGQDAAIREGLRACTGRWAVVLDGDLQDPPEAVERLWGEARRGFSAVFANRFGAYECAGRLRSSRWYRRTMQRLGGLPPGAGLFVLLDRRAIAAVCATRARRISVLAALAAARGRFTSVPIERAARARGGSAYRSGRRAGKALLSLWQTFAARRLGVPL
jgi:glycosyltransferase involved in cell wall biosynthesis